jgi:hypothetical protein
MASIQICGTVCSAIMKIDFRAKNSGLLTQTVPICSQTAENHNLASPQRVPLPSAPSRRRSPSHCDSGQVITYRQYNHNAEPKECSKSYQPVDSKAVSQVHEIKSDQQSFNYRDGHSHHGVQPAQIEVGNRAGGSRED